MRSIRFVSLVFGLLILTFTVRLGDMVAQLFMGQKPEIVASEALANEEEGGEKADKKKEAKPDDKDKKPDRQEIPPKSTEKKTEVKGVEEDDSFMESPYSEEELKVLQSLSKRREDLDKRAGDLDQREKLLQAAEKKVDEKVLELDQLKKQIEGLLNKQQAEQDASLSQLVKIYENMKPKDAANIFNDMQFDVLLGIITKMSERKVAPVLAAMTPAKAREISARLADQKALPKKDEPAPAQ